MLHQTVLSTKGRPIWMIQIICKQKFVLHISLQNPINPDGPDHWQKVVVPDHPDCGKPAYLDDLDQIFFSGLSLLQ